MTEGDKGYVDFWDGDGSSFWYRHEPPRGLDDLVVGEPRAIMITVEMGRFWLGDPRSSGQSSYDTLQEAKVAGDRIVDDGEEAVPGVMLKEAGLDASEWRFAYEDPIRFELLADETCAIHVATDTRRERPFGAVAGDDVVGDFASVREAAEAIVAHRAPRP